MQRNLHPGKHTWDAKHRDQDLESWMAGLKHAKGADPEPVVQDV